MKGHGAKFVRKKEEAIAALLSSRSVEDAAKTIGVNPNTLLRCLHIPEFRRAYLQATGAAGPTILKLMTDLNVPAVGLYEGALRDPTGPDAALIRTSVSAIEPGGSQLVELTRAILMSPLRMEVAAVDGEIHAWPGRATSIRVLSTR